jgi:hypothetical protein
MPIASLPRSDLSRCADGAKSIHNSGSGYLTVSQSYLNLGVVDVQDSVKAEGRASSGPEVKSFALSRIDTSAKVLRLVRKALTVDYRSYRESQRFMHAARMSWVQHIETTVQACADQAGGEAESRAIPAETSHPTEAASFAELRSHINPFLGEDALAHGYFYLYVTCGVQKALSGVEWKDGCSMLKTSASHLRREASDMSRWKTTMQDRGMRRISDSAIYSISWFPET